jgi:hypothetical protein
MATKKQLEEDVRSLQAYQQAFWCLQRGERPQRLSSGDYEIELLGLGRGAGGVVIQGGTVTWLSDWYGLVTRSESCYSVCPYMRELASKARALALAAIGDD